MCCLLQTQNKHTFSKINEVDEVKNLLYLIFYCFQLGTGQTELANRNIVLDSVLSVMESVL